jgi:tetratricopeptide (TPR) repeat protein
VRPSLVVGDNKDIIVSERAYPEFTTGWLENGLSSLAIEFIRSKEMDIAARLLAKAEETGGAKLLDRHFTYQQMAQAYYRHRNDDPEALDRAIDSCEKQIHLGPEAAKVFLAEDLKDYLPAHHGFQQLAIIRKREKDYAEAIRLCKEAMAQGWGGEWEKRIARCENRLAKLE